MDVAVHITHEAAGKIGGIGAVIEGICTARGYRASFDRTLLYGPLFAEPGESWVQEGQCAETLFSTAETERTGVPWESLLRTAEKYSVELVYGRRPLASPLADADSFLADVLLVGTRNVNEVAVANLKYRLWQEFGIQSDLYAKDADYEQYIRIAVPYLEILSAIYGDAVFFHFAHEYMGLPGALAAILSSDRTRHHTAFVAHEVSSARFIVESQAGHDLSFYNILKKRPSHMSLEDVFGSQRSNPRNELIKLAVNLDRIIPVSDLVGDEYRFLVPQAPAEKVKVVYNGIPTRKITPAVKQEGRERMIGYVDNLLNFQPDSVFTHVSRLVVSKGIWRDITLLYPLDELFDSLNLKGAYFLLSTFVAGGRPQEAILSMETDYGWPILHKEGWPDLVGIEVEVYRQLELFNSRSKAIKGIFINQLGFSRETCGRRVPEEAGFLDLRAASDAEFGLSVYEPFGIAQLETIPFGGAAILSSSCGCAALLERIFKESDIKPFYVIDFAGAARDGSIEELKTITKEERDSIERRLLTGQAGKILDVIPLERARREAYLENARKHVNELGWETAARGYVQAIRAT